MVIKHFLKLLLLISLVGCNQAGLMTGATKVIVRTSMATPQVTSVKVVNDQLVVIGKNLDAVTQAKIEGSTNHTFAIESKKSNELILNARSAFAFIVGETFNLLISSASGSATFPINFELQNGQVTAAKLHNMGATAGQVLRFNGTTWAPGSILSSQIYVGTYNATSDTPDIVALGAVTAGTYYIVTVSGTQDLGNGAEIFNVGDWVIYDGTYWSRVPVGNNTVSSFNGRTGVVTPLANDYSWSMLTKSGGKVAGSRISEIADVNTAGIQDGFVLKWDISTNRWLAKPDISSSDSAGSITNSQLASGSVDTTKIQDGTISDADVSPTASIAMSKILNLVTTLTGKENAVTAGTTAQYYRGDKTWQALSTTVVPEGTNLYFLDSRVRGALLSGYSVGTALPIAATDTLMQALGKLEAQIAANPGYWSKSGNDVSYAIGSVGVGTTTPRTNLDVNGTITTKAATLNGTSTINGLNGNIHYTTSSCGNFQFNNLKDGGSYMFVVKGTTSGTCVFTAYSDAGTTALTVHMPPDHGATSASKHTIYNMTVVGGDLYVAWTPGY